MPNPVAFLSFVLLTAFTPGPNNISTLANASRYGFRRTLRYTAGVFTGVFVLVGLACAFAIELYAVLPGVKPVMTVIGAAYILWLAYKTVTAKPPREGDGSAGNLYLAGIALQFVNPKAYLYAITAASSFIVPYYKSVPVLAGFALFMATVSFSATTSWAAFGSLFERYLGQHHRILGIVMGALLVYSAVSLFL